MDIYLAGTPVSLVIDLKDRAGNALEADTIEYRITKQDGSEVVARTALADFVAGGESATVAVDATLNQVAPLPEVIEADDVDKYTTREVRTVELYVKLLTGNTVSLSKSYALEPADVLAVGVNSFQSFANAELVSLDIPDLKGWASASEAEKIAALIEARARICMLNFSFLNSNGAWGQDSLNWAPEGSYATPVAGSRLFLFEGNLALLTPRQFASLPVRFKTAVAKAQVSEADAILGGDDGVEAKRREGLLLDTIGEVKQMFRTSKPLDLPVSRRTLRYLSLYVTFAKRLTRG